MLCGDRMHSSAGCSTSYSATSALQRRAVPTCRSRRGQARCLAQSRSYHTSPSPERDSSRNRHVASQRVSPGSVAAKAVSAPSSRRKDSLRSTSKRDIISTSIPDAIPSLEELEQMRNRVLQQGGSGSASRRLTFAADGPVVEPDVPFASPDLRSSSSQTGADSASSSRSQAASTAPHDASRASARQQAPATPDSGSALSREVPPPVPLSRPAPARGLNGSSRTATTSPQSSHTAFTPKPPAKVPNSSSRSGSGAAAAKAEQQRTVMQLTMAIKAVKDWRQLPRLLAEVAPQGGVDAFNAAAFLTHLAQCVAAAPQPLGAEDLALVERMQAAMLAVVESSMHEYRARQVSNITWALARLGLPSGAAFLRDHMLAAAYPLLPWYEPQHLANTLWALATAGVGPDDGWLEEYLTAAFVAMQRRGGAFEPQHLANLLWSLERMGVMPDEEWMGVFYECAVAALPTASGQDCSNVLSSLALMSMHTHRPTATADLATRIAARLTALLAPHAGPAAGAASTGRRGSGSGTGVEAASLGPEVLTPLPSHAGVSAGAAAAATTAAAAPSGRPCQAEVSDQTIANSLWAFAAMGMEPEAALWDRCVAAVRSRLADPTRPAPAVAPAALTTVLWVAATLRRPLPAALMSLVYARLRAPQLAAMEPRGVATLVWALAAAPAEQARPPADWLAEAAEATAGARRVSELGGQAVSNLLYGMCELGARPPPAWMAGLVNHFHRNLGAEASGQSVANVLWCLAKMGYRLNGEGMDILAGMVASRLQAWQEEQAEAAAAAGAAAAEAVPPPFNAQELSNILYAFATLGYDLAGALDGALAPALLAACRARLHEANAQELSNSLWSLSALKLRPAEPWLRDYYAAAVACLPSFAPRDLAQSLYGAAKLRLPLSGAGSAGAAWAAAALAAAPKLLAGSSALDLSNVSWALVQLGLEVAPEGRVAAAFTARLVALSGGGGGGGGSGCDAAQLALGVWALGKWRVVPTRAQVQQLEVATFRQLPNMRPHELAALLSGFAAMGHTPHAEWLEDCLQQVAARSREFGPQDWTVVLASLGRMQQRERRHRHDRAVAVGATAASAKPAADGEEAGLVAQQLGPHAEELALRLLPRLHRMPVTSLVLLAYSCGCMGPSHTSRQLVSRCMSLMAAGDSAATKAAGAEKAGGVAAAAAAAAGAAAGAGANVVEGAADKAGTGRRRMVAPRRGKAAAAAAATGSAASPAAPNTAVERLLAAAHAAATTPAASTSPAATAAESRPQAEAAATAAAAATAVSSEADLRPLAVSALSAAELSSLLWSAVRTGIKVLPADFRTQFLRRTAPLLPELPASLVASYLWAAGRLRMWLPSRWRHALVRRCEAVLAAGGGGEMRERELVMSAMGLMWLRVWPRRKLLDSLRAALESRGPAMDERMRAHAAEALRVLEARLVRARERRVVFPRRRADWVAAVRKGLEAKAKAAAEQEAAKHVAAEAAAAAAAVAKAAVVGGAEAAEARVSRRGALKAGVLRRRKSRLTGAAADVAAGAPSA
ncbi:hypothetical protein CHLRE_13g603250v5 [Chlamydomonas reinhardtii]|uniref:Tbc2 translation factor, chloroplastic n=1 Tax=Chlamydomonas reinhardtii TaxID=3055 RepID=A0A2K3D182_CHLRE|nr:uncharacterized protein CHLRE_13g603250v5 [Chlamydomonas reinhardtii]PNW74298.1 hypothetical protein CHLRE_13g603250v5 [Chlamydomonas reinhardtii]